MNYRDWFGIFSELAELLFFFAWIRSSELHALVVVCWFEISGVVCHVAVVG